NRGAAAIVARRNPRGIGSLMNFPQRLEPRMHALEAAEHFTADAHVRHVLLGDDRSSDGDGPLGVVRGFANPPLAFRIARISRNDRAWSAFETRMACGYQRSTSSHASISVCLPMASPIATPLRE